MDTHLYGDIHSAFVWVVVQLDTHDSEFDGITWSVAWPVRLNEGGDIPGAEAECGGVCENETVPPVAPHCQVEEGILGYGSKNLERLQKYFQ